MRKFATSFALAITMIGSAVASVLWPSPYLLMEPGPAMNVKAMISVPDEYRSEQGNIYLTSISLRTATIAQWMMASLNPSVRIIPRSDVEPTDIPTDDYRRFQFQLLDESKTVAKIVALRKLGYDVKLDGQGAQVEAILPVSPAKDKLEPGDTIVGLSGRDLDTASELVDAIRQMAPGDNVNLTIMRDGQRLDIESGTIESTSVPGQAMLGVLITTRMFDYHLPFDVNIDTENLAGPSAGLMFTLGIVDALTPGDLAKGHNLAGTGTIALDGTVGKIDGVRQKVIGAERAGADYYLAPVENYDEAKASANTIKVVPIQTLDDALSFISTLDGKTVYRIPSDPRPTLSIASGG